MSKQTRFASRLRSIEKSDSKIPKNQRTIDEKEGTIREKDDFASQAIRGKTTMSKQTDRNRSRDLPTTTETATLGTTATARLTSEIFSASNSTQRPPIVSTPTETGGGSTHTAAASGGTQVE